MKKQISGIKYWMAVLLLFFLSSAFLYGQLQIQFLPEVNGQSVNGLFTAQVQNISPLPYHGKIKITVMDGNSKTVLRVVTPLTLIQPGANFIQALEPQSKIQFGNSPSANSIAQTGRFPENDYEYCFEFAGTENKPNAAGEIFENCFHYSVLPVIPLNLVYPGDGDERCDARPGFTWQPAMPPVNGCRYSIVVAEKKDRQTAADALMNNVPVFRQDNINGFTLLYPAQVPDLQKDKKYVWQITAYEGNTRITQSEIWLFGVSCGGKKPDSSNESYRQLSSSLNGNYYMATGRLRFSVINPYNIVTMQYSITEIADPAKDIRNLPPVKVQTGLNKINIDLEDVKSLQVNKMYLLKVKNIGSRIQYLQFIYKGDEVND